MLRVLCFLLLSAQVAQAQTAAELTAAKETYVDGLRFLAGNGNMEKAGIRFVYVPQDSTPGNGKYSCRALDETIRNNAAEQIRQGFAKFTPAALRLSGLKYILLCSQITDSGRRIGGIPVPPIDLLMLSTGKGSELPSRFAKTALHEFFHYLEMKQGFYNDSKWNAQFGGYANSYGSQFPPTAIGSGGNDFINGYSMTFPHEDRAELFALIISDVRGVLGHVKKSQSPALAKKIEYVVQRCRTLLGDAACR